MFHAQGCCNKKWGLPPGIQHPCIEPQVQCSDHSCDVWAEEDIKLFVLALNGEFCDSLFKLGLIMNIKLVQCLVACINWTLIAWKVWLSDCGEECMDMLRCEGSSTLVSSEASATTARNCQVGLCRSLQFWGVSRGADWVGKSWLLHQQSVS